VRAVTEEVPSKGDANANANNAFTHFEPQFGPALQEGLGAYSYMLSVYLLLSPSMLFQGLIIIYYSRF
jgi:hypothetical protein